MSRAKRPADEGQPSDPEDGSPDVEDSVDQSAITMREETPAEGLLYRDSAAPACLVEVYGGELGRRIDLLEPPYRIGRLESNEIPVRSASVSRVHAELARGEYGFTAADRGSTNGTYVNDTRVENAPLTHGDFLKIGSTVFKFLRADDLDAAYGAELRRLDRVDGLTQLVRREAFLEHLDERMRTAVAISTELALILIELDALDDVRTRFGVLATDRVLSLLAGLIQQRLRKTDVLGRVGEACFALVLDGTGSTTASVVAEKLRRFVALSTFRYNETPIPVRIRTGIVGTAPGSVPSAESLLRQATAALHGD